MYVNDYMNEPNHAIDYFMTVDCSSVIGDLDGISF